MELKRVVVTGLGAVTPVGNTPEETWENLLAGKSGAAPITHFDTTNFKTKFACEVKDLNINEWIDRKEARKLDRYTQLAMIAAMQGVKDANIDLETEDLNNVGVVFGVGIGGIKTFEDEVKYFATHEENGPKFNPFFLAEQTVPFVDQYDKRALRMCIYVFHRKHQTVFSIHDIIRISSFQICNHAFLKNRKHFIHTVRHA